jgi:hypothetical protein
MFGEDRSRRTDESKPMSRFVLLIILEDLEQSRLLQVGRSKTLSFSQLERLIQYLQELEAPIREAL